AQSKDFEENIKAQEKEAKAKQETINKLKEIIKERDEDVRTKQEIISGKLSGIIKTVIS
ncbi:16054_t:CDS:2, partial [Funneliformis mosseae]